MLTEAIGYQIDRDGDAIINRFSGDRADLACRVDDAFGEAEASGKILEIVGRRHHDGIGDRAVNDIDRHFDGNILRYGKSVGAVETHAFRRNRQGNREQGCCQFIPPRLEAVAQSSSMKSLPRGFVPAIPRNNWCGGLQPLSPCIRGSWWPSLRNRW